MFYKKLDQYLDLTFYFLYKAIKMLRRNDITSSRELVTKIFYWLRTEGKTQVFKIGGRQSARVSQTASRQPASQQIS